MMINSYEGIPEESIGAKRTNSEGKTYTLDHPDELLIPMRYNGEEKSTSNSQGWERSSIFYFSQIKNNHPEYFSPKNNLRIEKGESPRVDAQFVKYFPQFAEFKNEVLVHHHIGKDGQATALPATIHKGSGEIHVIENELGITQKAQEFSHLCKQACLKDPSLIGKNANEFRTMLTQQSLSQKHNAFSRATTSSVKASENNLTRNNAFQRISETESTPENSYGYENLNNNMS